MAAPGQFAVLSGSSGHQSTASISTGGDSGLGASCTVTDDDLGQSVGQKTLSLAK